MPVLSVLVAGFCIGAIPACYWLGRLCGVNVFKEGSRNGGSTNLKRLLKAKGVKGATLLGYFGFVLDILKGVFAVRYGLYFSEGTVLLGAGAGIAAALGHCFSPIAWAFEKKVMLTGRGAATGLGVVAALHPVLGLKALMVWGLVRWMKDSVSWATICACLFAIFQQALSQGDPQLRGVIITISSVVLLTHIPNMRRLSNGIDSRPKVSKAEEVPGVIRATFLVNPGDTDPRATHQRVYDLAKKKFPKLPFLAKLVSRLPSEIVHFTLVRFFPPEMLKMGTAEHTAPDGRKVIMDFRATGIVPNRPKGRDNKGLRSPRWWVREQAIRGALSGARMIGYGGDTTIAGGYGEPFVATLDLLKCGSTTGNAFTTVTGIQQLVNTAQFVGYNLSDCTVLAVGAKGGIGKLAVRKLREYGCTVLIAGTSLASMEQLHRDLGSDPKIIPVELTRDGVFVEGAADIVGRAHLAVTVSSGGDLHIPPFWWRRGAIISDIARPRNVVASLQGLRPDVLVIDGAIVRINGKVTGLSHGLSDDMVFGCMAETIMAALEWEERKFDPGWTYRHLSIGKDLDYQLVSMTERWGNKHGLVPTGARSNDQEVSQARLEQHREVVQAELTPA